MGDDTPVDSQRSPRSRARMWALAGALWGLVSTALVAAPHWYFNELLSSAAAYRVGRALVWTMPSWYAIRVVAPGGWDSAAVPAWAFFGGLAFASMTLGAAVALLLSWITERLPSAAARRKRRVRG